MHRRDRTHTCDLPGGHGQVGSRWRCWCGSLWKLGPICDTCERTNGNHHYGQCVVRAPWGETTKWRRAPLGLRIRHRLHSRKWRAIHELDVPLPVRVRELEQDLARRTRGPAH